jgi:acyl carrier protein
MDRNALVSVIVETVEDYRVTMLGGGEPVGGASRLFGPLGLLDSLGLVSVLVEIEQKIADRHEVAVSLMDDRAMSESSSPFRTIDSLADYVMRQLAAGSAS